jgi:hypothetical protein
MKWKDFIDQMVGIDPPDGVDINDLEVVIVVQGERQFEFGLLGIDYDDGTGMGDPPDPSIVIQVRRQ